MMSQQLLPFYLVCDESASMAGDSIDTINGALVPLHEAIGTNPIVADKTRFCLISFSNDAEVLLSLSDLSEVEQMPTMTARGTTDYAAAFRVLKDTIDADVALLKAEGNRVHRPVVFFMSDGYPTSDWAESYQALVHDENRYRPNIIAFGVGEAQPEVIAAVATFRAFLADDKVSPAAALTEFAKSLTNSIVKSGTSVGPNGAMELQMDKHVDGFHELEVTTLPVDEI